MRGSIIKRGDQTYLVRLSLGKDEVTRKRLYHTETVHGTRKEAESRKRELVRQYEQGALTERSTRTLNELITRWLETVAGKVRGRTHEDYTAIWNRYLKEELGRYPLDKISPLMVQDLYNGLSGRLAALTIRRLHTVLNQALRQGVRWRMLARNPAADVELPSLRRRKVAKAFGTVEEAWRFIDASRSNRLGAAFRTALQTGMRPQEYLALQWEDIDWHKSQARITKAMAWPKGGGWKFDETKTEGSSRLLDLPEDLLVDLRQHRKEQLEQRMLLGSGWQGGEFNFVFTNAHGAPVSQTVLHQQFKKLLKEAELPDMRVYDLRHSHATLMLAGGVAPKVASERLGHSTITLTMDTYSHVLPTMQREAANKVAQLLRRPESTTG